MTSMKWGDPGLDTRLQLVDEAALKKLAPFVKRWIQISFRKSSLGDTSAEEYTKLFAYPQQGIHATRHK